MFCYYYLLGTYKFHFKPVAGI